MQRKKKNINTNNKYKKIYITMLLELKPLPLGRVVKRMGSRRGLLTGERLALYLHYASRMEFRRWWGGEGRPQ